jgi:hypothetical protein
MDKARIVSGLFAARLVVAVGAGMEGGGIDVGVPVDHEPGEMVVT